MSPCTCVSFPVCHWGNYWICRETELKGVHKCGVEVVENTFSEFIMKVDTQRSTETFWKGFVPPGHVDDLFPFFLRHAKQIFPMLDCMDDLRKISDLRLPPNWSVCSSGCTGSFSYCYGIPESVDFNIFSAFLCFCNNLSQENLYFLQWIKKKIRLYQLWKSLSWCGFSRKMFSGNVFGR